MINSGSALVEDASLHSGQPAGKCGRIWHRAVSWLAVFAHVSYVGEAFVAMTVNLRNGMTKDPAVG